MSVLYILTCVVDEITQDMAAENQTSGQAKELKLPIALEKVLAFKDVRVSQVGMKPDDMVRVEKGQSFMLLLISVLDVTVKYIFCYTFSKVLLFE